MRVNKAAFHVPTSPSPQSPPTRGGETGLFTRPSIIERQKDRVTEGWKYVIEGQSVAGDKVGTVTKLSITGKLIIITVYIV